MLMTQLSPHMLAHLLSCLSSICTPLDRHLALMCCPLPFFHLEIDNILCEIITPKGIIYWITNMLYQMPHNHRDPGLILASLSHSKYGESAVRYDPGNDDNDGQGCYQFLSRIYTYKGLQKLIVYIKLSLLG